MIQRENRLTVTLSEDSVNLLKRLQSLTGMPPPRFVASMFRQRHFEDLWHYHEWLNQLPSGPSLLRSLGIELMRSYGGTETLVEGIKRLDPSYVPKGVTT